MRSHEVAKMWLNGKPVTFAQPTTLHIDDDGVGWRLEATLPDSGPFHQRITVSAILDDGRHMRGAGRFTTGSTTDVAFIAGDDVDMSSGH